jgi:hypothetical protein
MLLLGERLLFALRQNADNGEGADKNKDDLKSTGPLTVDAADAMACRS